MIAKLLTLVEGLMEIATRTGRRKVAVFAPPFYLATATACWAFLHTDKMSAEQFTSCIEAVTWSFGLIFAAGNVLERGPKAIAALRGRFARKDEVQP